MEAEDRADRSRQDNLVDAASDMFETYRDLIKVRIVEQTSLGASVSILGIVILIIILLILLFAGLGAAWWIGDSLDNMKAGFFIVGGIYTLLLLTGLLTANSFILPNLRNLIIRKIYEQD